MKNHYIAKRGSTPPVRPLHENAMNGFSAHFFVKAKIIFSMAAQAPPLHHHQLSIAGKSIIFQPLQ